MTVPTTTNKHIYEGNGSSVYWPYTFTLLQASDIKIYITKNGETEGPLESGYDVDIANNRVKYPGDGSGLDTLEADEYITVVRSVDLTQELNLTRQGPLDASTLEDQFDKQTMISQQLQETLDRCVKYGIEESPSATDTETYLSSIQTAKADAQSAASSASTAQGLAEDAQAAAEAAQGLAETAQGAAEAAQGLAETAQGEAEAAQGLAETAQGAAEAAQGLAESARDDSQTAQAAAESAQGLAEGARDDAQTAQTAAETAQGLSETAQAAAEAAKADAETAAGLLATGTFDNELTLKQITEPTTPAAGYTKVYAKSDGLYKKGPEGVEEPFGAGGGGLSVIDQGDFNASISGVSSSDATNLEVTHETGSPLVGNGSLLIEKKNSQDLSGQYVVIKQITVPEIYEGIRLSMQLFFKDTGYIDNGLRVGFYSLEYGTETRFNDGIMAGAKKSLSIGQLPARGGGANEGVFEIRLYVNDAETTNYTFVVDNWELGVFPIVYGSVTTEWKDYTPVWSGQTVDPVLNNGIINGRWRRVGDSAEIEIGWSAGSTTTFGTNDWYFSLPSGLTADTAKFANPISAALYKDPITAYLYDSSNSANRQFGRAYITESLPTVILVNTVTNATVDSVTPFTWAQDDRITLRALVPIVGWEGQSQLGVDAGASKTVVAAVLNNNQTINTTWTEIVPDVLRNKGDDTGIYSTSTGRITVRESGHYLVGYSLGVRAGASAPTIVAARILIDGSDSIYYAYTNQDTISANEDFSLTDSEPIYIEAGHYVSLWAIATVNSATAYGGGTDDSLTKIWLAKVGGPSAIFAAEKIEVIAAHTTGSALSDNAPIVWNVTDKSTHGSSVWDGQTFTAPHSGTLHILAAGKTGSITPSAGQSWMIKAIKGASTIKLRGSYDYAQSTTNRIFSSVLVGSIDLLKGETVGIKQETDLSGNLSTSAGYNTLSLKFE